MKQINKNILNEKGSPRLGEAGMALQILILIIVIIGMAVGVFLVQKTQIFKSKATDSKTNPQVQTQSPVQEVKPDPAVESLTNELLKLDKQYDQTVQTNSNSSPNPQGGINPDVKGEQTSAIERAQLNKMIDVAAKRKEILIKKLEENPQEFLTNANLIDKRDSLPEEVKGYIEKRIHDKGEITVIHNDNFKDKESTHDFFMGEKSDIKRPTKVHKYKLHFSTPQKILTGDQIQIEAIILDKEAAVISTEALSTSVLAASSSVTGEQKALVMMIRLSTDTSGSTPTFTKDYIRNFMFGIAPDFNSVTVNSYYKDNSFNKISFSGDVVGEYVVNGSLFCDSNNWANAADSAAVQDGIDLGQYNYRIYVFKNYPTTCGEANEGGSATLGGVPGKAWIFNRSVSIYLHEVGHMLGNAHANLLKCGQNVIDLPTKCQNIEYDDGTDIMGVHTMISPQFNGPHKVALGWIPTVQTVTVNGTYTISPLEVVTTEPQILRISKPDTGEYYYVSYRQKTGYDIVFPEVRVRGAYLHIWNENPNTQTKLLDTNPSSTADITDASLTDGASFYDPINNIRIKQTSHILSTGATTGNVSLEISFSTTAQSISRRVFVTSQTFNGNLGGLTGADAKCQQLANNSTKYPDLRNSTWKAWLSDRTTSVGSRLSHAGKFVLLDGTTIANDWTDLTDGNLLKPINMDENDNILQNIYTVWTNTKPDGSIGDPFGNTCKDWLSADGYPTDLNGSAREGVIGSTNFSWTYSSQGGDCSSGRQALYCFEEPIVNPSPSPVISPSPAALYTISYKLAETPTGLATAEIKPYDKEPILDEYTFVDTTPGNKFIWAEFKDNLGNLATRSAQIELLAPSIPGQRLSFNPGWNLVSLNVEPNTSALKEVMKPLEGRYTKVLSENGIFATNLQDVYVTLREMHMGQAYYLRISGESAVDLQVNGQRDVPIKPLALHKGWNWIGYLPTTAMKVTDALSSIAGKYQFVASIDKIYDSTRPTFSTLEEMVSGQGYLIYMSEAAMLTYPSAPQSGQSQQVKGVTISSCDKIAKTPAFTLAYGQVNIDGISAPVGTRVEAITSQGVIAGCFTTKYLGEFGMMYLYGKDATSSPPIPGFNPNEEIIWHIDGQVANSVNSLVWQSDRTPYEVSLNSKSSVSPSPTPLPTSEPAGRSGVGGSGGGSSSGGGGGGGGAPTAKKTIKYIKYAEDPYSLSSAPRVPYYPGDPLPYTFKNSPQGNKYFIFIRFEDENGQVFKINGQDYITQSIDVYSGETPAADQPPTPNTPPSTGSTEQVTIGTMSLSTSSSVSSSGNGWSPVSINLSLSGFSSPGRSIAGLFVRNQVGECSVKDCGYNGWTQIRSYGTNGTDTTPWTASGDLSAGVHMFAAFSLNADGTAGQLLAVSKTNFGSSSTTTTTGGTDNGTSTSNACISLTQSPDNATSCSCTNSDSSAADFAGKCYTGTGQSNGTGGCNGGWCNGGKCQTCSP